MNLDQDTKPLISSIVAASRFGITNDYVTMLARQKKISGVQVDRVWYVEPGSLGSFLQEIKKQQEQKRAALSQQLKQEYKTRSKNKLSPPDETLRYEAVVSPLPLPPTKPEPLGLPLFTRQALAFSAALALMVSGAVYATEGKLPLAAEVSSAMSALSQSASAKHSSNILRPHPKLLL